MPYIFDTAINYQDLRSMRLGTVIFFYMLSFTLTGQIEDYKLEDFVYMPHIKSVKLHHAGLPTSDPIIDLNSQGQLILTFDDILGGDMTYNYKVIHCDKDWNPTDMDELDYVDGFNDEDIDTWFYSQGTQVDYTHYQLAIPNNNMNPLISGNFILLIYEEDTELPVLTRRFMVLENQVIINAQVRRALQANKLKTHQQLELSINHEDFDIYNPQREVYVSVLQNGRWDNRIDNRQPVFVSGDELRFDAMDYFLFNANKEFRFADIRSLRYPGFGVHTIDRQSERIDVLLSLDKSRYYTSYFDYNDLNGKFIIDNQDQNDDQLSSQYIDLHFTLEDKNPPLENEVYVIGGFTDWQCLTENRLSYDVNYQSYVGSILLKQGYYDYQYVVKDKTGALDYSYYEGNLNETINDYTVLVYLRTFNSRYDRLIGATIVTSAF